MLFLISTKFPTFELFSIFVPGLNRAKGPIIELAPTVVPSKCENARIFTLFAILTFFPITT